MGMGLDVLKGKGLSKVMPFRFGALGDRVLLTNEVGGYAICSKEEFEAFVSGTLPEGSAKYSELLSKHFFNVPGAVDATAQQYGTKNAFLFNGPYLHIVIVTLRCNEVCAYCHASRRDMAETSYDMSPELARQVVDTIFESPSPNITIEFQGGEPLANFGTVQFIVDYAVEKNRTAGKKLEFSLITNLALMDQEKLDFLIRNNVQICTSIDGPKEIHDSNRKLLGGSAHQEAVKWMRRIDDGYQGKGLDPNLYHVEALLTVTRKTLGQPKEVVDEYVALGRKAIFLRSLNPFGFARQTYEQIGYGPEEFLDFYVKCLDYMLELNRRGVEILERTAAILLTKILSGYDPNYLDLRSPCGAGIGQVAYNYNGTVFTCDEGRMVYQMGDDIFQIGTLPGSSYTDLMESNTVKALTLASTLETLPHCMECVYKPYCGVCPVYNYAEQGSLHGVPASNGRCKIYQSILDYLFSKLASGDQEILDILARWTIVRDRSVYFSHE